MAKKKKGLRRGICEVNVLGRRVIVKKKMRIRRGECAGKKGYGVTKIGVDVRCMP